MQMAGVSIDAEHIKCWKLFAKIRKYAKMRIIRLRIVRDLDVQKCNRGKVGCVVF